MQLSRFNLITPLLLVATVMTFATPAVAKDALQMRLEQNQVVKNAQGKTTYVPVTTAEVGSTIQYKAIYSNVSNQEINDILITVPIPINMTFAGSAYPLSAQASIDGKNYGDIPLMRNVNGKLVKIPYSEYKSLRWNVKILPAHKSAAVSLDATMN